MKQSCVQQANINMAEYVIEDKEKKLQNKYIISTIIVNYTKSLMKIKLKLKMIHNINLQQKENLMWDNIHKMINLT